MDTVYYDGDCALCVSLRKWLSRLDLFGRVRWVSFQSLDQPPAGLSWNDLESAAYLRSDDDRLYEGFYAFRALTWRLPLLMVLAPILWLPGVGWTGERVYGWVAANRHCAPFKKCVASED